MGPTLPVTCRLITQDVKILKTHIIKSATAPDLLSPGPAQPPQRGFDQQPAGESEGAHGPRTAERRWRRMEWRQASFSVAGRPWDITWQDRNSRVYQWTATKDQTALQLIEHNAGDNLVQASDRNKYRVHFTCMWFFNSISNLYDAVEHWKIDGRGWISSYFDDWLID